MFNEERKLQYIAERNNQNLNLPVIGTRLFNQISEFEEKYNRDCCDFVITEISDYYKNLCSSSIETLASNNSIFAGYTDWCLEKGYVLDHQNHYREFNSELFSKCVNVGVVESKIFSRKEIEHIVDDLDNASDAAFVLALFEGICGKNMCELTNLSMADVDGNKIKLCTGREIEVSSKLISLLQDASDEMVYYTKVRSVPLAPSDKIFKIANTAKAKSSVVNRKCLYTKMTNIKEWYDLPYLTTFNLLESGRIHMINQLQEQGQSIEQIMLIDRSTEERYGKIASVQTYLVKYGKWLGN